MARIHQGLVVGLLLAGRLEAMSITLDHGLISTIGESFVYNYATGQTEGHALLFDQFDVAPAGAFRAQTFEGDTQLYGAHLETDVTSRFLFAGNRLAAEGSGAASSDVINLPSGYYGAAQSLFITNLYFRVDGMFRLNWEYVADGYSGPLGTSDGIDVRFRLESMDASFTTVQATLFREYYGSGAQDISANLTSGFYHLVTQGRVLFNQPNVSNRDGSSWWSYEYSLHPVPEPGTLALVGIGVGMIALGRHRRRRGRP